MRILAIETSCDETAVAVVRDGVEIECSLVRTQYAEHAPFGGVVPEIASRSHLEELPRLLSGAAEQAGPLARMDAVAVTARPGLIGSLLVGVSAAKALAYSLDRPLIDVHHVHAHVYAAQMANPRLVPPFVALVVSGGHTSLYRCAAPGELEELGATVDDAAGEAFDKVGKLLGLAYPGGPAIERAAASGNPTREPFKRPRVKNAPLDFSFSGLKTAMLYRLAGGQVALRDRPPVDPERRPHLAAGFQEAAVDHLVTNALRAARECALGQLALGGGVACNGRLRERLSAEGKRAGIEVFLPPPELCTDNAVMIGGLAYHLYRAGHRAPPDLDASPR